MMGCALGRRKAHHEKEKGREENKEVDKFESKKNLDFEWIESIFLVIFQNFWQRKGRWNNNQVGCPDWTLKWKFIQWSLLSLCSLCLRRCFCRSIASPPLLPVNMTVIDAVIMRFAVEGKVQGRSRNGINNNKRWTWLEHVKRYRICIFFSRALRCNQMRSVNERLTLWLPAKTTRVEERTNEWMKCSLSMVLNAHVTLLHRRVCCFRCEYTTRIMRCKWSHTVLLWFYFHIRRQHHCL